MGSRVVVSWATAAANLSATGSLPWYSGGLSIALGLLRLSSLFPGYRGNGSLASTGEICGGST
jgi:hypothetical protein